MANYIIEKREYDDITNAFQLNYDFASRRRPKSVWFLCNDGGDVCHFLFLLIRPQQKRAREHKEMVGGIAKNDTVVTAGGLIGKVVKVIDGDDEATIEIATGVKVKVLRATLQDVRSKKSPKPANDAPAKKIAKKK